MIWAFVTLILLIGSGCSSIYDQRFSSVSEIQSGLGYCIETTLDLDGWELWRAESSKGDVIPGHFRFYFVRGHDFRKVRRVGDLAARVRRMEAPADAIEFIRLISMSGFLGPLLLDGRPGYPLSDVAWDQIPNRETLSREPRIVGQSQEEFVLERVVGQYKNHEHDNRAVLIRETVAAGRYRWEVVKVVAEPVFMFAWR